MAFAGESAEVGELKSVCYGRREGLSILFHDSREGISL